MSCPFGIVGAVHGIDPHRRSVRSALRAFAIATLLCGVSRADEAPRGSAEFFDHFCSECHYEDQSGGLDLSVLDYDPANHDNFATWTRILDRVTAGEMPPKKKKERPAPTDLATFEHAVSTSLTTFEKAATARDGRAMQRRLGRGREFHQHAGPFTRRSLRRRRRGTLLIHSQP